MHTVSSEACERNKEPILAVLRAELAGCERVLEIGSGSGQHAVHFATHLPQLAWQPSEVPAQLAPLAERLRGTDLPNLRAPLALDVRERPWRVAAADAVFSANTLHIMAWERGSGVLRRRGRAARRAGGAVRLRTVPLRRPAHQRQQRRLRRLPARARPRERDP